MQVVRIHGCPGAGPLARRAADELRAYTTRLWNAEVVQVDLDDPDFGTPADVRLVIGVSGQPTVRAAEGVLGSGTVPTGPESYVVRQGHTQAGAPLVVVTGADDAGVLYGTYALLEALGLRFYLSGPSVPRQGPVVLPDLELDGAPVVRLRGFMPYTDFLTGPTVWDEEDYIEAIDNAARLRLNMFSMHFYTFEPVGDFEFKGRRRTEAFWDTSRTTRWHKRPGRLSDFVVGQEKFAAHHLAADTFGARSALQATTPADRFRLAEHDIRVAFDHAKQRGMQTTIGFEVTDPPLEFRALVDPADRYGEDGFGICPSSDDARELLKAWLAALVETFPSVDTYTLWQSETGPSRWTQGCPCDRCSTFRREHPLPEYRLSDLLGEVSSKTYDVEDITESAQTFLQWVLLGYDLMQELAPDKRVALAGWYIEHLFRAGSKYLPTDLVLSSMTEVDPWEAPPLLDHFEGVDRERWLINWWEIDFRMWLPQPKVSAYPPILEKVRRYGVDAVIWQHWRTRTVDDNARYTALAMWNPTLSPREYYVDAIASEWGAEAAEDGADALLLFEEYERWLCHDLGWQVFAQDWFPPAMAHALEFMGVHGAIPANVVDDVTAKASRAPEIRARLGAVQELLAKARAQAKPVRDGDRPGFWERRLVYYQFFVDCLESIGTAALAYQEATRGEHSIATETDALRRTYNALRAAPVLEFIKALSDDVEDKGDLGTLVNLNNELWTRYRDALDGITRWFTDAAVGGLWTLRIQPDGSLRPPVIGPDALRPEGQWS